MNLKHGVFMEPYGAYRRLTVRVPGFRYRRFLGLFGYYYVVRC